MSKELEEKDFYVYLKGTVFYVYKVSSFSEEQAREDLMADYSAWPLVDEIEVEINFDGVEEVTHG